MQKKINSGIIGAIVVLGIAAAGGFVHIGRLQADVLSLKAAIVQIDTQREKLQELSTSSAVQAQTLKTLSKQQEKIIEVLDKIKDALRRIERDNR